jgi:hypothetical protein
MDKKRIKIEVELDLAGHDSAIMHQVVHSTIARTFEHYNPETIFRGYVKTNPYQDFAMLVTPESRRLGGELFMNNLAVEGWYYIRSTDPTKHDMSIPPRIFRKFFEWVEEEQVGKFAAVREIN